MRTGSRWWDADLDRADADAGTLSAYSTMVTGVSFKPQISVTAATRMSFEFAGARGSAPSLPASAFVNRRFVNRQ